MAIFPRRKAEPKPDQAPGKPPVAGEGRTASFRYLIEDTFYAVGRGFSSLFGGLRDGWFGLPLETRRKVATGSAGFVLLFGLALLVLPSVPCQLPGGDSCPAEDEAIELVPDDALAYLHLNLDSDTEQGKLAADLAAQVPTLVGEVLDRFQSSLGSDFSFDRQVGPWFGGEAAVAVLSGSTGGQPVLLLETTAPDAALAFAAEQLQTGGVQAVEYERIEISVDGGGTGAAVIGGFLAVGNENDVRSVVDAAAGSSLADVDEVDRVFDTLPDLRFAEAYASEQGAGNLLAGSQLDSVVNIDATEGVGLAVVAGEDTFTFETASLLNSDRAEQSPGFFGALPVFEPKLSEDVPSDSIAYMGLGDPADSITALLEQAATAAPGILSGFQKLQRDLARQADVNLQQEILPLLGDEVAVSIGQLEVEGDGSQPSSVGAPFLSILADNIDEETAREGLARLQGPLAASGSKGGTLRSEEIDGVETNSLSLNSSLDLTYAIFDGRLAMATDPAGVEAAINGDGGLKDAGRYEDVIEELPDEVSTLVYLDLERLIALAEVAGLGAVPDYARFSADVRRLQAAGLAFRQRDDLLESDFRIVIGPGEDPVSSGDEAVIGEPSS